MFDFAILICEELGVVLFDVHRHTISLYEQVALSLKYFVKVMRCLSIDINLKNEKKELELRHAKVYKNQTYLFEKSY